jgi:GNAT superfamily N-acetyltransferase
LSQGEGRREAPIAIRPCRQDDIDAVSRIILPVIRAGETYALPPEMSADEAIAFWCAAAHAVFVATDDSGIVGTYFLCANQQGGGDHVANAGFITAEQARGRGVARAMAVHALETARERGFLAMQFNFVVATNGDAVGLWQSLGFGIVGRLPGAFRHPNQGLVEALVMYRHL